MSQDVKVGTVEILRSGILVCGCPYVHMCPTVGKADRRQRKYWSVPEKQDDIQIGFGCAT